MEITLDHRTLFVFLAFLSLLSSLGLAALGKPFTPETTTGQGRILTWDDWQFFKAERRYTSEREILRSDTDALAMLLDQSPDPVAAQLLASRIAQHTANGEAALSSARSALQQAAQDVASWTAGTLDRDTAVASLQTVVNLLK